MINNARIVWEASVSDPAYVIGFYAGGAAYTGTKWQRFLIRLLGKSIVKVYKQRQEKAKLDPNINKAVWG